MTGKTSLADLALFGGPPAFTDPLHVGRPNIGSHQRFLERAGEVLDRGWLTNRGPLVQEFERELAERLGVRECIAFCNATIALEVAIRALGLGGEVIVPSLTFVATAHALQWQEITPVFCDVDPETQNLDPARVEEAITPRTTGIVGVHLWGRPCDVDALAEIAGRRGLALLFDAAHAFGCSYRGQMIGAFGDAEVFSFHATKVLNTFEGGAVTTNNAELAAKIRLMQNFGFAGYDSVVHVGTNGKMSEISAAMGLTGLEELAGFVQVNRRNHRRYAELLRGIPGLALIQYDEREENNCQYVIVEVEETVTCVTRDRIAEALWAENVLARRYFHPGCHRMEPYRTLFPTAGERLPVTERLTERLLALPTGTAVGEEQIERICELLRFMVSYARSHGGFVQAPAALCA